MGGIVKSIFGSGSSGSSSSSGDPIRMDAYNIAKPLYANTITTGQNFLNNVAANPAFSGQRVAGLNPFQVQSANNLGTFSNQTSNLPFVALNAGMNNLEPGSQYGANAQTLFNRFDGIDPTQSIINNAGLFANNPFTDGLIDASARDVVRNLNENTLPTLNRQFSGTGNTNSTRAGVESAIAQRGAADRLADLSSQIRSQFFGRGLDMSQNQFNQNLQNSLAANNQLFNAANLGRNLLSSGQDFATTNFNQGQLAGGMFQQQNQNELNANKAFFDESQANLLRALTAMSGVAGQGQGWSGGATSTTQNQTQTPSIASIAGSILKSFF